MTARTFSSFADDWARYPPGGVLVAGIELPRAVLHGRIERRVDLIFPGLVREAEALGSAGFGGFLTATQAIGYAEALALAAGQLSQDEARRRTIARTKALARRQLAWFRRDPRIRWFPANEEGAVAIVDELTAFLRRAAGRVEA